MTSFDVGQIDDVIHGRFRLGIMAYLARKSEVAEFNKLKDLLQATQGNLSVHLRKLEGAGYVAIEKSFLIRRPVTRVHLTSAGRKAFGAYLDAIGRLVSDDVSENNVSGNSDGAFLRGAAARAPVI